MIREENSDSIPTDLFLEIFSRLPAKSIGRFRCVSKQWSSMLHNLDFTDLFFTKSSARPRLLFGVEQNGECFFFSSPHPKSSSLDFHTKFVSEYSLSYGCGLIYFRNIWIQKEKKEAERVICNPITGQYTILPELKSNLHVYSYLGCDPIDKQFKLLVMNTNGYIAYTDSVHHIMTLGSGNMKWRNVQCSFTHEPFHERICINGVLYYLAQPDGYPRPYMIVFFDVRSEEFKFIDTEGFCHMFTKLVNYKGKLGAIHGNHQVLENKSRVFTFVDHVEDLTFDMMRAATSISPPEQMSTSIRKDHQVRTVDLCLLDDDDEFTRDKTCESDTSHLQLPYESKDHSLNLTLEQTMKSSRLKNEKVITEEVAKASVYKEADKSCKVISGRLSRGSGCLKGTAITAVVVAAAGAVAAVVLSSNPEATMELMNLVDSYFNAIITALKN